MNVINSTLLIPEVKMHKTYNQKDTPWYFGAHLNQARHNLYLALNELTIKIGGKPIENDDQIISVKGVHILQATSPNPNELEKAMEYYDKNFPFLFYMQYKYETDAERDERIKLQQKGRKTAPAKHTQSSPARYYEILKSLISFLNTARNHYNHYNTTALTIDRSLVHLLNDSFDINVRLIKNRFNLADDQLQHLKRYNGIIRGTKKPKENDQFWYSFSDSKNPDQISTAGLAFLTCLFLTKGESFLFLKKLPGFKRAETSAYKATLEVFTSNMLRVPKERLESDTSPQAVFLDMCNELAKCPAELFEQLEPEKQKLFITSRVTDEDTDNDSDQLSDDTAEVPDTKMVRNADRFLFFAQRYLDITHAFQQLRFGVDIGTYFFSIYPKKVAGIEETRQLTKHLLAYGRLEDFDKSKRPPGFTALYKDTVEVNADPDMPYIRETAPHYQTEGNNIPLYMGKGQAEWPVIKTIPVTGKSYPNKLVKENTLVPYAMLSIYEMPALVLYHLLRKEKKQGDDIQTVIINHINNTRTFFTALLNGDEKPVANSPLAKSAGTDKEYTHRYELLLGLLDKYALYPSCIPDKLVDYLLALAPVDWKEKAARRLNEMRMAAAELIENMESREKKESKPGKPGFRKIKVGKLAQLLAEDMMLMQPVAKGENGEHIVHSKPNSLAYRLLQGHLAYYGEHKGNIAEIFRACNLVGATNPHPFLHRININNQPGIIEFYKAYFKTKVDFLDKCLREKDYEQYKFLRIKQDLPELKSLLNIYLSNKSSSHSPFNLPAGLFHRATKDWLNKYGTDVTKKFLSDHPETNTVHLINHLFSQEDRSQEFYHWKRYYRLFSGETPLFLDLDERRQEVNRTMKSVNQHREIKNILEQAATKAKETFYSEIERFRTLSDIKKYTINKYRTLLPDIEFSEWNKVRSRYLHDDTYRLVLGAIDHTTQKNQQYLNSYKFFIENEKYLRLIEAQDMLLFMAIKDLLKERIGDIALSGAAGHHPDTFLLKHITPEKTENNKNLVNCRPAGGIHMSINFYEVNENGTFKKENNGKIKAGTVSIVDKHLKIKNAGNFRKLLKDRRLNNLCFYFKPAIDNTITMNRMVLENELKAYNKQRLKVLELVASFEKTLYTNSTVQERATFLNNDIPEHKLYLQHYFNKYQLPDAERLQANMLAVRNAFAHNQFPLIRDGAFMIAPEDWEIIHQNFQPSAKGSHQNYGIIEKIGAYATAQYQYLIDQINENNV